MIRQVICRACGRKHPGKWKATSSIEHHPWTRKNPGGVYIGQYCDQCFKHKTPYSKYQVENDKYQKELEDLRRVAVD